MLYFLNTVELTSVEIISAAILICVRISCSKLASKVRYIASFRPVLRSKFIVTKSCKTSFYNRLLNHGCIILDI